MHQPSESSLAAFLITMSRELLAIASRYESATQGQSAATVARVNARLEEALERMLGDLRDFYERREGGGSIQAQMEVRRSQELKNILQRINPDNEGYYEDQYTDLLSTASQDGSTLANELISSRGGDDVVGSFSNIPFEAIVFQSRDGAERLHRHTAKFQDSASAVIELGLTTGKGAEWMEKELRNKLGVVKHSAETIARTEVNSALNDAAQARYGQAGLMVQVIATPSTALCPYCAARNGNVYKAGVLRIPLHPRCRCLSLPWSKKWQKNGLTSDSFIRDYHKERLKELRSQGLTPNYTGVSPFEKMAGLKKPPKPAWTPRVATAKP